MIHRFSAHHNTRKPRHRERRPFLLAEMGDDAAQEQQLISDLLWERREEGFPNEIGALPHFGERVPGW